MATRSLPSHLVFHPRIQELCREYEDLAMPEGGLAMCEGIDNIFLAGFRAVYICALIRDVLRRWGLGGTMTALGDALGTDHTAISRAFHWGEFSSNLESYLHANKRRPKDWEDPINAVFDARHRSGFMYVAEFLAGKIPNRRWHAPHVLTELHTELLFELMGDIDSWEEARRNGDNAMAANVVKKVLRDPSRDILPFWLTNARVKQVRILVVHLRDRRDFAFKYLCFLQDRWARVFAATKFATESLELIA